jgi:hypothetical protein
LALRIYGLINSFLCFCVLFTNVNVSCCFFYILNGIAMRRKTFVKRHLTEIIWFLPASLNITLVSITIELNCASHTYTPRSSSVVVNICNSYCFSCSLSVTLNLSLPLKAALIVEPWDMMEPLCHHLRTVSFSYWHYIIAVPGIAIHCIFISLMVPWRPSLIVRKKYKIKCMYMCNRLKMIT